MQQPNAYIIGSIVEMQVFANFSEGIRRKWFFDTVPVVLPQVGDFIDTKGAKYYELTDEKREPVEVVDKIGRIVKIFSRIFVMKSDGLWIVQYSGE